jgi:hypothetical protein
MVAVMTTNQSADTDIAVTWFLAARAMASARGDRPRADEAAAGLFAQAILGVSEQACLDAKRDGRLSSRTLVDCLAGIRRLPHDVAEKILTGVLMMALADRQLHPLEVRWISMLTSAADLTADDLQRCSASARVMASMLRPPREAVAT